MKTIQKKVKFSKGMIAPELVERTDLNIYDSSASMIKNCVSTVYGGLKTRLGTRKIASILSGMNYELLTYTPTTTLAGNTENMTDLTTYKSAVVNTNRLIQKIDFTEEQQGTFCLEIKDMCLSDTILYAYMVPGSYSLALPKGDYKINCFGGGAGGCYYSVSGGVGGLGTSGISTTTSHSISGGSGAGFIGVVRLEEDETVLTSVGAGGALSYNSSSYNNGGPSTFGTYITAGGGYSGKEVFIDHIRSHAGGILTLNESAVIEKELVLNGNNAQYAKNSRAVVYGGASVAPFGYYTAGGNAGYRSYLTTAGNSGVLSVEYRSYIPVCIAISEDDITYKEVSKFYLSSDSLSLNVFIDTDKHGIFRYVKIYIDEEADLNIPCTLSYQYIRPYKGSQMEGAGAYFRKFIFNNEQKYLLVLTHELIYIFCGDKLEKMVVATGLLKNYLKEVKTTQNEDTMIFTHPNMKTKQLQRTDSDWVWSDFDFQNIPYHCFGTEVKTNQSISITPSSEEGQVTLTAASVAFYPTYVGQYIDGNGGRFKITEYISDVKVGGYTVIPFYNSTAFSTWTLITGYEPVWSLTRG